MQKKNRGMIVMFVAPALLFFIATFVYPIIRTVIMSFFKIDNVTAPMSQWSFTGFDISKYVNNQYLGLPKLLIWDFFICDNYNKPLYLGKG